jgi:hypothetical protein
VTARAPLPEGEREGSVVLTEGLREGMILGVVALALGVAGLSPTLTWIPEVPLLAAFVLVPVVILGVAGYRAGKGEGRVSSGAVAGAIAGGIGGCVGGLTYVAYGKPALNVVLGLTAGVVGGAVVGAVAARLSTRRERT